MAKLIVIALLALIAVLLWRNWSRSRREAYITAFPYQRFLDQRLAARHPGLTAEQRNEVFAALDDYFQFCRKAGRRMVSMPSQAVDDAWHEFILFTRQYDKFCRHAFGRFLHHTPAEAMSTPTQASDGLKRAWRLACAHEKIDPKKPDRLPRLFALPAGSSISWIAWPRLAALQVPAIVPATSAAAAVAAARGMPAVQTATVVEAVAAAISLFVIRPAAAGATVRRVGHVV